MVLEGRDWGTFGKSVGTAGMVKGWAWSVGDEGPQRRSLALRRSWVVRTVGERQGG